MTHSLWWDPSTPNPMVSLSVGHEKIYRLGVKLSKDAQGKNDPFIHPIDHWIVGLPMIYPP